VKVAYFDCVAGIAGDMALGALIDAGADVDVLRARLSTLPLPEWRLHLEPVKKAGIAAARAEVRVGGRDAGSAHGIETEGDPDAGKHTHENHHHGRTLGEVLTIIRGGDLPESVEERAAAVFRCLAEAEARVHGASVEAIHFHEVGALDSIVDIVGVTLALHLLGIEGVLASPAPVGSGSVQTAHGLMPVPAPATAELLKGIPICAGPAEAELTTPTGAALLKTLASEFGPLPAMRVERIGYGAGRRDFAFPNVTRVLLGETTDAPEARTVRVLEANLDDQSPELFERVMERLFAAGALDVYLQPAQMKKNRPGQLLSVVCRPEDTESLAEIVFSETSTFGLRYADRKRLVLEREWVTVSCRYGEARVKLGRRGGRLLSLAPEYEDCLRLAKQHGCPLKWVYAEALDAARRQLDAEDN